MNLKVSKQSASGLNTEFVNIESGRHIPLEHVVEQIKKGNPNYSDYHTVNMSNGTVYIRSNPDKKESNNIEGRR